MLHPRWAQFRADVDGIHRDRGDRSDSRHVSRVWRLDDPDHSIFFPIAQAIGLDPVQFGVMIAVNQEIAQIHPPTGLNLVTVSSISGIPLTRMMVSILPFIAIELVMIYLLYFFPQLTLFPACPYEHALKSHQQISPEIHDETE